MNPEPTTVQIARHIGENGLSYREDGRDLLELLRLWSRPLVGRVPANELEVYLAERLVEFDAAFGWDHPYQSQEQEEDVFGMIVHLYVGGLDHGRKGADRQDSHTGKKEVIL